VIAPERDRKSAKISFSYTTIVLERKVDKKLVPEGKELMKTASLADCASMKLYEGIGERNLFRPFVEKRDPPKIVVSKPPKNNRTRPRPPVSRDTRLQVVSLACWGKGPEIWVKDTGRNRVERLKIGEPLAGGTISCVDYRNLPEPNRPENLSPSRVIIKIGGDYYAVELGWTLNRRYLVHKDRLPPELSEDSGKKSAAESRSTPADAG
jgi:hypothetical protein